MPPPMSAFVKDPVLNLHTRGDFKEIAYSDGREIERRMLGIVQNARDRSVFSEEIRAAVSDWPTEYHFSPQRHCLVRPLGIKPGDRVLEVGCGCGAITRFLGETGADVTAVEGSSVRARITAERCSDLQNVRVFAEDLTTLDLAEKFDWVLLIGVLEYAGVFSPSPDPAHHYLESLAHYLAPGGRLVVAIENKLGLKYFNGCGEDHLGTLFSSVQGLYRPGQPRTYGRRELTSLLSEAGFAHVDFWYPFPDYKFPNVILSDAALKEPGFRPQELLVKIASRDYAGRKERLFQEPLVWRELARNGLLADFSNSFLVVASREEAAPGAELLAASYAVQRRPEFATETVIRREGSQIAVVKTPLCPGLVHAYQEGGLAVRQNLDTAVYVPGTLALWRVIERRNGDAGVADMVDALAPWFDFLLGKARVRQPDEGNALAHYRIAGDYQDCTPFNLVETGSGAVFIDREWRFDGEIDLGWVVTRSVFGSLTTFPGFEDAPFKPRDVVAGLCAAHGMVVADADLRRWLGQEWEHQRQVSGRLPPERPLDIEASRMMTFMPLTSLLQTTLEKTIKERDEAVSELARIRRSRIWRYAAPLRKFRRYLSSSPAETFVVALRKSMGDLKAGIAGLVRSEARAADAAVKTGCLIVTPPHTLYLATIYADELTRLGFATHVASRLEEQDSYQYVIVFCPNVFEGMKDGYIAVQMEQTVNARWFTPSYLEKLQRADSIIDYSVSNIEFLKGLGYPLSKLFYVPAGMTAGLSTVKETPPLSYEERDIDVLFYGDASCQRRTHILKELSRRFKIRIETNTFGPKLWELIRRSKLVLNIHYYENALLETVRLSECLSLGTPVVSETSSDKEQMDVFGGAVSFAQADNVGAIEAALDAALVRQNWEKSVARAGQVVAERSAVFTHYFRRFAYATDMIGFGDLRSSAVDTNIVNGLSPRMCLTLAETPERFKRFKAYSYSDKFTRLEGIRHRKGWIGCGLSYKLALSLGRQQGLSRILICEDDAAFPRNFDQRMKVVESYLEEHDGEWDIFSGFVADISPHTKIHRVDERDGTKFVWMDRTVSMVFNIYGARAIEVLSEWNPDDDSVLFNTIDRYMQRCSLRVVMAVPHLVGHDTAVSSTIWGFRNTRYQELIDKSESVLQELLAAQGH